MIKIGVSSADDLVELGINSVEELAKIGVHSLDDLAKIGITSTDDLAKVGVTSADDFVKGGSDTIKGSSTSIVKTQKNVEMSILPEGSQWERNVLNSFSGGKSTTSYI